jgi:hypothetical protein
MAHRLHKHAFRLARTLNLAHPTAPEDRLQHIMQIVVVFGVLVMFIAWLNTVRVIRAPGTFVGAGVVKIDTPSQFAAYVIPSINMGLDFMLIQTKNPEIESLCVQEKLIRGFECYFISNTIVEGEALKVCEFPEIGCNAIELKRPSDLNRAIMSCTSLPPSSECIVRALPLWHRTVFSIIAILYFLVVVVSILFRQESLSNKVLKFWRNII